MIPNPSANLHDIGRNHTPSSAPCAFLPGSCCAIFENLSGGIALLSPGRVIRYCNASFARFLAASPAALAGFPFERLLPLEDRRTWEDSLRASPGILLFRLDTSERCRIPLHIVLHPFRYGGEEYLGVEASLSAALQNTSAPFAQHMLSPLSERFTSDPEVILHLDAGGRILFMNSAGRLLFGYTEEEITQKSVFGTVLPRKSCPPDRDPISCCRSTFEGNVVHKLPGGRSLSLFWKHVVLFPGKESAAVLVCWGMRQRPAHEPLRKNDILPGAPFLARSSRYFLGHPALRDVYSFTARHLHSLVPGGLVAVFSYERSGALFTLRGLAASEANRRAIEGLSGDRLSRGSFSLPRLPLEARKGNFLLPLASLSAASGEHFPRVLSAMGYKELGFDDAVALPLSFRGKLFGCILIALPRGASLLRPELMERFAVQASIALRRAKTEEGVQHAAGEWRAAMDALRDPVLVTDTQGRILRVNKAFAAGQGMRPQALLGRQLDELFPRFIGTLREVLDSRATEIREIYDPAIEKYFTLCVTPLFNEKGEITKLVHVMQDITAHKEAESVLKRDKETLERLVTEKTKELLGTRKDLADARRLSDIGVLAATIAHEIRNPLAAIKTAAYNIRRKCSGRTLDSHLATVEKKVMESDQIIRNLLSYSRIKDPACEFVAVLPLMNEIAAAIREKYSRESLELAAHLVFRKDLRIEADPVHLRILFTNLLDNAVQSLPGGRGTVGIHARETRGRELRVDIVDNGTGIDGEDLSRVLDPFFTRKTKGIGLGLTVCNQIVNLHHGTLELHSEKGRGTTVTVTLPLMHRSSPRSSSPAART